MLNFHKNGQNTAEYAIVISLVIAAAIAMQVYVKRAMQGGIKFAVDNVKKRTPQYEPYYLESKYKITQQGYTDTIQTEEGGKVTHMIGSEEAPHTTTRTKDDYQKTRDTSGAD